LQHSLRIEGKPNYVFVIQHNGKCTLLEVKASSGNVKSTKTILKHPEAYHVTDAIKLGDYHIGRDEHLLTLPFYMGFQFFLLLPPQKMK
jgi:hypothetical protein